MGITVAEDLVRPTYQFADPSAFLSCDNPACDVPWVTAHGLVCWTIEEVFPSPSRFSEKVLVACSRACLRAAQQARGARQRWSEPLAVGAWLGALADSLNVDPASTPIGKLVSVSPLPAVPRSRSGQGR